MPLPRTIKDAAQYQVTLASVVPVPGVPGEYLRPGESNIVSGAILKLIKDAVTDAVEVKGGDAQ